MKTQIKSKKTFPAVERSNNKSSDVLALMQREEKGNDAEKLTRLMTRVQPKPKVSRPDDPQEQEADKVANRVMSMTKPNGQQKPG
jgi:hypothetical protein